jgi:16S rRNA (cytosine967-C5)-methyltransferase
VSRFNAYINNAARVLDLYDGSVPLAVYLKQYFAQHKKFGSKDRKQISALCYQYFRLGYLMDDKPKEEKLLTADFICNPVASDILKALSPAWVTFSGLTQTEKMKHARLPTDAQSHTRWLHLLQPETKSEAYVFTLLRQPLLFLRVRPGKKEMIQRKLENAGLKPFWMNETCISLPNSTSIDDVLYINKDVVVQDASSQQCGSVIHALLPDFSGTVWDACAASGGKSIMLHDIFGSKIKLLVSDIRPAILHNLKARLKEAGIYPARSFLADLTRPLPSGYSNLNVDMALVDAPCTGSGTWARTPEQHHFFNPDSIQKFSERQMNICRNVIPHIVSGGYLIYITCSVFRQENIQVIAGIQKEYSLKLLHEEVINGMDINADSMFIAILQIS